MIIVFYNIKEMNLKNKTVLVIGLARSGKSAIELLDILGADIILSEAKKIESKEDLDFLNKHNVKIIDQDNEIFKLDYDLIIKNPGVPPYGELVNKLKEKNIAIITEIELAYMVSKKQHYIAITGSNGKTTSTSLTYEILKEKYHDKALLGGNIGTPLCELVTKYDLINNEGYYIALEISNHQLVDIDTFKPDVSTIINLSPDHLETMLTLENYYWSKTLVYKNQDKNDYFLLNEDDEEVKNYLNKYHCNANIKTFSLENDTCDIYLKENNIYLDNQLLMPINEIKIKGQHNIQNVLVCALATYLVGVDIKTIRKAINNFNGVEHRLEFVREVNGVSYYNDSKATNVDASITALKAFDKNVILLVGGHEKGLDVKPMRKYLTCVKQVIGFGLSGKRIASDLVDNPIIVNDLKEAINISKDIASKGDIVLLSPTTSSYDQYKNYEERGKDFKNLVHNL